MNCLGAVGQGAFSDIKCGSKKRVTRCEKLEPEKSFGSRPAMWLGMQMAYDLWQAGP